MNDLLSLVRWALLTLGMIYFITESAIFVSFRVRIARSQFGSALIYCAACTGFWVGLAHWFAWPRIGAPTLLFPIALESAIAGMALGAIWSAYKQGNPAWHAEAELRGVMNHAEETAEEDDE